MFAMRRHNSSIAPAVSSPPIKHTPRFCGPSTLAAMRSDSATERAQRRPERAIASAISSHTPPVAPRAAKSPGNGAAAEHLNEQQDHQRVRRTPSGSASAAPPPPARTAPPPDEADQHIADQRPSAGSRRSASITAVPVAPTAEANHRRARGDRAQRVGYVLADHRQQLVARAYSAARKASASRPLSSSESAFISPRNSVLAQPSGQQAARCTA